MFYQFHSYIRFLLQSTNQHGVHSPFVFDFVTKGLYKKSSISKKVDANKEFGNLSPKEKVILTKITNYFKIDDIITNPKTSSSTSINNHKILFFNNLKNFINSNILINQKNNILVIRGIYNSKKTTENWNQLITSTPNIVSVNLFYFGIIFYRPQQAKEHFNIRV